MHSAVLHKELLVWRAQGEAMFDALPAPRGVVANIFRGNGANKAHGVDNGVAKERDANRDAWAIGHSNRAW